MSHHVTLNSLVLSYKRSTEGQGSIAAPALAALLGYSIATIAPLPDLGVDGAGRARMELLVPGLRIIASDATEIMPFETPMAEDIATAIYLNRYDIAWGGHRSLESFTVKQMIVETFGGTVWQTVQFWAGRFLEATRHYYREKLSEEGNA